VKLALFDLDHTLIAFDSGGAWIRFLVARGVLPAAAAEHYLGCCRGYVAGRLDIRVLHRACIAPLAPFAFHRLLAWRDEFERAMAPQLPAAMRSLVGAHLDAGDRCAIVTATSRFVAEPFARLFGVPQLIATESEIVDGRFSGEVVGQPCHREHKPAQVSAWLAADGSSLRDFARSAFYTDSIGDLPLLQAVSEPVAVAPDAALRALALARGWRIVERAATAGAA
jgi:HAD superfamily hydrolase (TIGR01490 family)